MDRQAMIDESTDAMRRVHDFEVPFSLYAAAIVDRLGWRAIDKERPDEGDMVIATDGKRRWMDMYFASVQRMTWDGHVATHWHPILDFPAPPQQQPDQGETR